MTKIKVSTRLSKKQKKGKSKTPHKYYLTTEQIISRKRETMATWNEEGQDKCYCDGPMNDCRNDWDGDGPPPPCPNAPDFERKDVDV